MRLGASEKTMQLFFPVQREEIRGRRVCVWGRGGALDRELLGGPSPGRCVLI
jgi:hypothetical protein